MALAECNLPAKAATAFSITLRGYLKLKRQDYRNQATGQTEAGRASRHS